MIKLFVTDIDGCLSTPFETPDWNLITSLRELSSRSDNNNEIPPISICTGRPQPYAEAVAQWLDVTLPIIFESSGLYYPGENRIKLHEDFTEQSREKVHELKDWLLSNIISSYGGMELEFAKIMDAGLIHPDTSIIDEVVPQIESFVSEHYPEFEVHKTEVSVNTLMKSSNKKKGILQLCSEIGVTPAEVAYIGDSSGDIPALEIVGQTFAPANAHQSVKEIAGISVLSSVVTQAVLDAYQEVIRLNKQTLLQAENH